MLESAFRGVTFVLRRLGSAFTERSVISEGDVRGSFGQFITVLERALGCVIWRRVVLRIEGVPLQYAAIRCRKVDVHNQSIQEVGMLVGASGNVDLTFHRQDLLIDLALELDAKISGFPSNMQGALSGNQKQMRGLDFLRPEGMSKRLTTGQDADEPNQHDEPPNKNFMGTHATSPQVSCLHSRTIETC